MIIGGDNSTALNATQTYTPAPSAFVSDDGTLVLTGPASPGTPLSTSASADRLLWWVVAVILLVGIMCRCGAPLCLLTHVHQVVAVKYLREAYAGKTCMADVK